MHPRTSSRTFRRTTRVLFVALAALSVALCSHGSPDADHISALSANESSKSVPKKLPKIIDLFLFNGEFEYLDIRLHETYRDIDFFAIAESNETFTGTRKPLYFKDNAHLFDKFMDKIHYIQVPPMPADNIRANDAVWGREHYTRDKAFKMVLDDLHIQEGDWIILSDLDEILRPSVLQAMRAPDPDASPMDEIFVDRPVSQGESWDLITFGLRRYLYAYDVYFGTRFQPVAMRYREEASHLERVALRGGESALYRRSKELLTKIRENDWATAGQLLRQRSWDGGYMMKVDDAGWHCSWCFRNMSQFLTKFDTYGHREYNTPKHRRRDYIIDCILQGLDFSYWSRTIDPVFLESPDDIPEYIRKNKERYSYMLTRRGKPNAGLLDVEVEVAPVASPPSQSVLEQ